MTTYKIHPFAETFPPFSDAEFESLLQDIGEHGQREPITLFEGRVIDGVHRLKACRQLNLEPRVRNYNGKDPLGFSVSENLKRRHLNESQRAMIAAKLANGHLASAPIGALNGINKLPTKKEVSASAARLLNVGTRSVERAQKVLKEAPKIEVENITKGRARIAAVEKNLKPGKETVTDKIGRVVPDEMISEWERATQVGKKLQSLAREIKSIVSEGFSGAKQDRVKDVIYAEINNSVISDAEALAWAVSSVIPFALCPSCQGFNRKTCGLCKKRGWLSKFLWNSPAVSEETKRIISGK